MRLRSLLVTICAAAAVAPTSASATPVVADPAAEQIAALGGTLVWVSGEFGSQALMMRSTAPDGQPTRVPGAPVARSYHSIDLGRDARGALVLTYIRCLTARDCSARRDDLRGRRASFRGRGLVPARCSLTTAPAIWRARLAYGLLCRDRGRSGLYVKTGSRAPRRVALPADAVRYGADEIASVDLRGTGVAAVAADIYEYAFTSSTAGARRRAFLAAASEGDGDAHARGLALGPGGVLWSLTTAEHVGDPNRALVFRDAAGCHAWQTLANASAEQSGFRATDLAADETGVYLIEPGTGIVAHEFAPDRDC